ncbi:hypothetical protein E6O75_ATG06074 [Venturia nashicola]|uniref:Uncharacterized protein n=1 Tax=Venturia nashicola TaxID=86259 RepID=A0A4Z1PCV0_9PEZI|nr:hypothetical protein E6O75_ATG06074 [Venturia nashicola]
MLSPHPTHASLVSPETTGVSQQEIGHMPAQQDSAYVAPPLQEPMGLSEGQQQLHGQAQMQGGPRQRNLVHPSTGIYQTAIPLVDLERVPAPVDCPRCNMRGLTEVEYHSGGFTQ